MESILEEPSESQRGLCGRTFSLTRDGAGVLGDDTNSALTLQLSLLELSTSKPRAHEA